MDWTKTGGRKQVGRKQVGRKIGLPVDRYLGQGQELLTYSCPPAVRGS